MAKILPTMLLDSMKYREPDDSERRHNFFSTHQHVKLLTKSLSWNSSIPKWLIAPLVDVITVPCFIYDAIASLLNCFVSIAKGVYFWTMTLSIEDFDSSFDDECNEFGDANYWAHKEFVAAREHLNGMVNALVAAILNPILSTLALLIRPIITVVKFVEDLSPQIPDNFAI